MDDRMTDIQKLAATLQRVAAPGMAHKDLIAAVREQHPKASKKEIVRAAFYALLERPDVSTERAQHLHAFALTERSAEEGDTPRPVKLRKKSKRRGEEAPRTAR
jgi:uncharacterized iron-regulated membrane protein